MIRSLTYALSLREGAEGRQLARYLELEEGRDLNEQGFIISDPHRSIHFTPAELAELHEAIHEMLRMHDQHVDALTDGASVGAGESGKAVEDGLSADERAILQNIACGCRLEHNTVTNCCAYMLGGKVPYSKFMLLRTAGLIELNGSMDNVGQSHVNAYLISDEGRRVLAEADDGG